MATAHRPSPPTSVEVNGKDRSDEMALKTQHATITAKIDDPNKGDKVRLVVLLASNSQFDPYTRYYGTWVKQGQRSRVRANGLSRNTLYRGRLYTQDEHGNYSKQYTGLKFWTNRPPLQPELLLPAENSQFLDTDDVHFQWKFSDPDGSTKQKRREIRWRPVALPGAAVSPWTTSASTTALLTYSRDAGTFAANRMYEWQVRSQDAEGSWSDWSIPFSFLVTGVTTPPRATSPVNENAVVVDDPVVFTWVFSNPVDATQTKADLRFRVKGTEDWLTLFGTEDSPGADGEWVVDGDKFQPNFTYEWQVRTYNSLALLSGWSDSAFFNAIAAPGSMNPGPVVVPLDAQPAHPLGSGVNRAFVYDRGGMVPRGEIKGISTLMWSRKRDDISNSLITINEVDGDNRDLLLDLHCWMHEVVIFRDNGDGIERVWEGPVTRIEDAPDQLTIEAKDSMVWVYRRIMRQGYNDSYRLVDGRQIGLRTVVDRASLITMNALSYSDPNVLPYLTIIAYDDDTRQSRVVADYSKTAWGEIDDLAATAGLDYTTVGRRIIFWDTHRPIGQLPEMRGADFLNPPVVTEYGMQTANHWGVTNNGGVYGTYEERGADGEFEWYGPIEQLASAYGEADGAASVDVLTAAARAALVETLSAQAERNMRGRNPTPIVVRVPDNATLSPDLNIGINQLVPGVWIPLRAVGTLREITQMQKLDSITVTQDADGEKVAVVMSPAPTRDEDPDSAVGEVE